MVDNSNLKHQPESASQRIDKVGVSLLLLLFELAKSDYPGGKALASTISSASITLFPCSFCPSNGDLGSAIRPLRADSKIPNGAISFMKESILMGFAELD